jgi:hypothetical protein
MQSAIMLSVLMLSAIMLSVIMLSVIIKSVIVMSVTMFNDLMQCSYVGWCYAECHYTDSRGANILAFSDLMSLADVDTASGSCRSNIIILFWGEPHSAKRTLPH